MDIKSMNNEISENELDFVTGGTNNIDNPDRFRMMTCPACHKIFRNLDVGEDGMCPVCGKEKAAFCTFSNMHSTMQNG